MTRKSTDVTLNIRARNLAGRTLDEINDQVEKLASNNEKQAASAQKAARSMRDLESTSRQLAGAYNELSRREGLTRAFIEQRKQIGETAAKLQDLTATYREMQKGGGGTLIGFSDADVKRVGREIIETQRALDRMVASNQKAAATLDRLGIDAADAAGSLTRVQASVERAGRAYSAAQAEVASYSQAQQRAAEIAAEAAKRQAAAQEQVNRAQAEIRRVGSRNAELAALRADIEARSAQARAVEVQAEAQRRLAAEQAAAQAKQERATAAIREAIAATEAHSAARRRDAAAAFGGTVVADGQEMSAKQRLLAAIRALVPLRGQARAALGAETAATRSSTQELDRNTGALNRNAAASRRAGEGLALFSDVGRKSLGTYQRLRGQILGLTAAYVGFYQVINTTQQAIAATNRNNALRVSLVAANKGDIQGAADDMAYLRKEAERLGLVFDDLAPKFAGILIGANAGGLNKTQTKDMFSDLQLISAGLNLSAEAADRMNYAVTQIFSKGRVQAEELSGQIGDVLPGAFAKFAESMRVSGQELTKRMKEGKVTLGDFVRFVDQYADQFRGSMDEVTERLQAYINRAKNAYNDFLRSLLTGANDQKLKDAFARIETFFRSDEGQKFASALATAFGKAIDVFIALADNIDLVVEAVKIFIGLQLLKFLNDAIIGAVALGGHFKTLAVFVTGYDRAARIAAINTGTLTGRMSALAIAAGPIVGILAALTAGAYAYSRGMEDATESTEEYADALHGLTFAKTETELSEGIDAAKRKLEDLNAEYERLRGLNRDVRSSNPLKSLSATAGLIGEGLNPFGLQTTEGDRKAYELLRRMNVLTDSIAESETKLKAAVAARQAQEAKDRLSALPGVPTEEKDTSKAERNAENRRLSAARAVAKELLDLDQAIFDARLSGEVRTAEEVQKLYQVTVDKIASETEERYLKLQQQAQAIFSAAGINTPAADSGDARADYEAMVAAAERLGLAEAAALRLAGERVELLRTARNDKAFEVSETQDIEVLEKRINDLVSARQAAVELINAEREAGVRGEIDAYNAINATQDGYNQRIRALVETIMPLLQAIGEDDPRFSWAQGLIADFNVLLVQQRQYTAGQRVLLNLGAQAAQGIASAVSVLAKGVAGAIRNTNSLADAFKAARDAFMNFAADFLVQIGEMILQAIILQAIKNAINDGAGGGYWGAVMGALGAGTNHTGGIVGGAGSGPRRMVDPRVFAGAQRFHSGGLPGLRSGEVATILKKGEEVVPEDNPRHIGNGGGGVNIDMITTMDPAAVVSAGIRAGRQTFVNDITSAIRANRNEFKTALGIN